MSSLTAYNSILHFNNNYLSGLLLLKIKKKEKEQIFSVSFLTSTSKLFSLIIKRKAFKKCQNSPTQLLKNTKPCKFPPPLKTAQAKNGCSSQMLLRNVEIHPILSLWGCSLISLPSEQCIESVEICTSLSSKKKPTRIDLEISKNLQINTAECTIWEVSGSYHRECVTAGENTIHSIT